MRKAWGRALLELGEKHPEVVVINGDVEQEVAEFRRRWPRRIFNLGITEQSITTIAAGMASEGLRPIVYSITPFVLERPFEQIKIDIDEQNLPVMLVGYSDYPTHGPTHRPLNPSALCACFKHVRAYFPTNSAEAYVALHEAFALNGPSFVSLKRDRAV